MSLHLQQPGQLRLLRGHGGSQRAQLVTLFRCGLSELHVALAGRLRDAGEHSMVRHEAAESLGAIAAASPAHAAACEAVLREYLADPEPVVAESCAAALDINAYWTAFNAGGAEEGGTTAVAEGDAGAADSVSYAALKRQQDRQQAAAAAAAAADS